MKTKKYVYVFMATAKDGKIKSFVFKIFSSKSKVIEYLKIAENVNSLDVKNFKRNEYLYFQTEFFDNVISKEEVI